LALPVRVLQEENLDPAFVKDGEEILQWFIQYQAFRDKKGAL